MSSKAFLDIIATRRTFYQLGPQSPISDLRIQEIIEEVILNVPSAFNSQTTRVALLVKQEHVKLWNIVKEVVKGVAPAEQWPDTEMKLNGFQGAYGTVLFFDDRTTIHEYQAKFPLYASKIPTWAIQSNGMHQLSVWTALEQEGFGANLQHYNPLIDAKIAAEWKIPGDWELSAQLVFGNWLSEPNQKTYTPVQDRFKVYGSGSPN